MAHATQVLTPPPSLARCPRDPLFFFSTLVVAERRRCLPRRSLRPSGPNDNEKFNAIGCPFSFITALWRCPPQKAAGRALCLWRRSPFFTLVFWVFLCRVAIGLLAAPQQQTLWRQKKARHMSSRGQTKNKSPCQCTGTRQKTCRALVGLRLWLFERKKE
ncbi:hypothetical protein TW95_gp1214 [Pandoravirus inopinatum]|uniref:Uncharacterized protein n=1 Tax=Pandoravirus inopinatum TaxID=1605721 RepID=A0A0B5IYI5_9VIRU|nr:hypothetical protein TW95_gp1214 [Pandoravirus inopinatum]AJF97948.1 hypothetical protein [Pandoravirus inopinatum]